MHKTGDGDQELDKLSASDDVTIDSADEIPALLPRMRYPPLLPTSVMGVRCFAGRMVLKQNGVPQATT
jgi:hypothetical protein